MEVFEVTKIPEGVQVIPTRWVYTHKEDDLKGAVYKARCVVQGFRQKEGIHFNKYRVSSPVVDLSSIRTLTAIATELDYPIHHLDIKSAYLNAPLPKGEEIYVTPPPGYDTKEGHCWLLKKSVYGMKQSGFEWYTCLASQLKKLGLKQNDLEETIFTKESEYGRLIVALYVDDLFLVASNERVLDVFKSDLENVFDLKYFGLVSEYLGIEFEKTDSGYTMGQRKFLEALIETFRPHGIFPHKSPMKVDYDGYGSTNNAKEDAFFETPRDESPALVGSMKTQYESGVGSINWAANNTRPDLAFVANSLASRASNPSQTDFKKLMYCMGYISQSFDQKLEYSRIKNPGPLGTFTAETFSDASFAPEADVKSISGMTIYINRNLVAWLTKKQKNITRSTAAAELVALSIAEDRTVHLVEFMRDLGCKVLRTHLYEDNQAVIACCHKKSLSHTRKMVDIRMKIIRERLSDGYYSLEYVNSMMNIADMFTKALPLNTYRSLSKLLFSDSGDLGSQSRDSQT
ncbi:hypothetical protein OY671_007393 [Metschnikowia pulcherrima]|nr:hypothetical protein OY671_007393 [Metschnikowia pulcherrima]